MAERVSDSESQPVKPRPKRRRILDPSSIVPVPVYSNKVSSSLQFKPQVFTQKEKTDDAADDTLWTQFSSQETPTSSVVLSDSDNEAEHEEKPQHTESKTYAVHSPSPPPPQSPDQKLSRKATKKINEIDRRLQAVNSLLSPEPRDRRRSRRNRDRGRGRADRREDDAVVIMNPNDDDSDDEVIILTPDVTPHSPPYSPSVREFPLKVRCRTDVHKIRVLSSTPLSEVLDQLSVKLKVPPPRLLLLREEAELPTTSTIGELGLGIVDIIECVVMAAEEEADGVIVVRLQAKDRDSSQEFSLHRDAALGSVFSQYMSSMSASAKRKVRFHFDGCKVTANQTPAQLDMEDGDIIEVWT